MYGEKDASKTVLAKSYVINFKSNKCVLLYFTQSHTKSKSNFATLVSKITVEFSLQKFVLLNQFLIDRVYSIDSQTIRC